LVFGRERPTPKAHRLAKVDATGDDAYFQFPASVEFRLSSDDRKDAQITELLQQLNLGTPGAVDRLLPVIYDELHGLARNIMAGERHGHTLQPTALINEAFIRLIRPDDPNWQNRGHFLRLAARAMRNVLVDHARARKAEKRGGERMPITLDVDVIGDRADPDCLIAVHETLERLHKVDSRLAQIVELRFFGGFKNAEIGATIGISERSVERGWRVARDWLTQEIRESDLGGP
jgi:RNA polymerase sigma factor (TIGR02999 family)